MKHSSKTSITLLWAVFLVLALAFPSSAFSATSPLSNASCTSSFSTGGAALFEATRQARVGLGCTEKRDLTLSSSSTYTLHRVVTHYEPNGKHSVGASMEPLRGGQPCGLCSFPNTDLPPGLLYEDVPVYAQPGVSGSTVEREQLYVTDAQGSVVHGTRYGSWSVRQVKGLTISQRGRGLQIHGSVMALCGSCWREVGLYSPVGAPVVSSSSSFRADSGAVEFTLPLAYGQVQEEQVLELRAPVALRYSGLSEAGQLTNFRSPASAAPKTDVKLLVKRVNGRLQARVIRPQTTDAQTTVRIATDPKPVAFVLSSSYSAHPNSQLSYSSCCDYTELVPDYHPVINRGYISLTLNWQRLLLPNEGRVETIYAVYSDGTVKPLQQITTRRYGEHSKISAIEEEPNFAA